MRKAIMLFMLLVSVGLRAQDNQLKSESQRVISSLGVDVGFRDITKDIKIGADFTYKYLIIGGSFGVRQDEVKENNSLGLVPHERTKRFDAHIGGNFCHFLSENYEKASFFIEGRLLVGYEHSFHKYYAGVKKEDHQSGFGRLQTNNKKEYELWKTWGDGDYYIGITPRIGFRVLATSFVIGYRWDFPEFKFKKEYIEDTGYLTIGIQHYF